jgi:hypothetical protein
MSSCAHLEARDQARAAIARVSAHPAVIDADLIAPDVDPTQRWTVEIAIDGEATPPAVLRILADEGLSVLDAGPRATWHCVVAVV